MIIYGVVMVAAVYCACLVVLIATAAVNSDVMFAVLDFVRPSSPTSIFIQLTTMMSS